MSEAEELELLELESQEAQLAGLSTEKNALVRMLPNSVSQYFSSPRETAEKRMARGQGAVPPTPQVEYSPAEEAMLGSIVAPGAMRSMSAGLPLASGLLSTAGSAVLAGAKHASPILKKGAAYGLGDFMARKAMGLLGGGGH